MRENRTALVEKTIEDQVADRPVDVDTAARLLSLSPWTIRAWVRDGKIRSGKMGGKRVVPLSEIQRLIDESIG